MISSMSQSSSKMKAIHQEMTELSKKLSLLTSPSSGESLISSSASNHQLLHPSLTTFDTDILMSQFAPITNSSIVQHSSQLHPNSTFQTAIENLQQQMSVLSTQFAHLTSPFQPIFKPLSPTLPNATPTVIVQPNILPTSTVINNSANIQSTIPSTLPIHVPPINTIQTSLFNNPNDINSISLQPPMISLPNTILHPSFTMNLNNNLPTFKGLTHERPIQFINNFEIRASTLVVLFDGALTWFGQLQKSPDRVNTWNDFKFRFYERYHTPAKVQSLHTELRLFFQDDDENTLD
ncbi:unnamed protein product [Rotaria socialis]|uniref:Retrotransposon gag domain-containing protein n=1 Tax=Rotaria socialis TaxID=392032 RepID=A0A820QB42_9BILA|nr:unnamed protein product [Rotaria socialis]